MVVAMIVPALLLQFFEKAVHPLRVPCVAFDDLDGAIGSQAFNRDGCPLSAPHPSSLRKRMSEKWPRGGMGCRSIRRTLYGVLSTHWANRSHGNSERQPSLLATG